MFQADVMPGLSQHALKVIIVHLSASVQILLRSQVYLLVKNLIMHHINLDLPLKNLWHALCLMEEMVFVAQV